MSNGIMDSFFTTLQNNPSLAAGTCTFAVAFALVAGNAFYAQSGSHPDPIWATRDHTTTQSVGENIRQVKTLKIAPKTIPTPATGDDARSASKIQKSEIVSSVQDALARKGYFSGDVDGLMGPLTSNSIKKFQAHLGLKTTGIASQELLLLIERDDSAAAKSDPLSGIIADNTGSKLEYDRELLKQVQSGIAKAGIAQIDADGIYGKQTEAAIMDFQRRYDLDVTGRPDQKVIKKLEKLKLIESGQSST